MWRLDDFQCGNVERYSDARRIYSGLSFVSYLPAVATCLLYCVCFDRLFYSRIFRSRNKYEILLKDSLSQSKKFQCSAYSSTLVSEKPTTSENFMKCPLFSWLIHLFSLQINFSWALNFTYVLLEHFAAIFSKLGGILQENLSGLSR